MTVARKPKGEAAHLGFAFDPGESTHHFLVTIPAGNQQDVLISEHYTWRPAEESEAITFAEGIDDGKLRVALERHKWNDIADEVRIEFNRRMKKQGLPAGVWSTAAIRSRGCSARS